MSQEAISLLEGTCGRRIAQFGTAFKGWNDFKSVKVDTHIPLKDEKNSQDIVEKKSQ